MTTLADVYNLSPKEISILTYSKVEGLETRVGNHSAELKALEEKIDEKFEGIRTELKAIAGLDKRVDRLESGKSMVSKGIDYGITGVIAFLTAHLTK